MSKCRFPAPKHMHSENALWGVFVWVTETTFLAKERLNSGNWKMIKEREGGIALLEHWEKRQGCWRVKSICARIPFAHISIPC